MGLMDPATHKIRLNTEMCATCPGNPRGGVALRPGRLREVIRANTGDGRMGLVCHSTIDYSEGSEPDFGGDQALCKWFYDHFGAMTNGIRVMLRLGGFTEVPPPVTKGFPAVAAKLLTPRESAVLRIILDATDKTALTATGHEIARLVSRDPELATTLAGAHSSAASLCRKGLAVRAGTPKLQWYTITQGGRDAVRGDMAGKWRVRP